MGLIGPNGCGKTTFLKMIIGDDEPTAGEIELGSNIDIGYFDQNLEGLNQENKVIEELWEIRPSVTAEELRSFLARFLFTGEDVFRQIKTFSGGEQSRVVLAKLLFSDVNFLVLDEPTNHLDIASREVLEQTLKDYEGTALLVSHDRYFLDKMVNRIYSFEGNTIKEYLGNYSYYQEKQEEKQRIIQKAKAQIKERKKEKIKLKKKIKKKKRKLIDIENEIAEIEDKIDQIEEMLKQEEVYTNWQRLTALTQEKEELSKKLDQLFSEWELSQEGLDEAKE